MPHGTLIINQIIKIYKEIHDDNKRLNIAKNYYKYTIGSCEKIPISTQICVVNESCVILAPDFFAIINGTFIMYYHTIKPFFKSKISPNFEPIFEKIEI